MDKDASIAAIKRAVTSPDPAHILDLIDPEPAVRMKAIDALAARIDVHAPFRVPRHWPPGDTFPRDTPLIVQHLIAALSDPAGEVRARAAEALSRAAHDAFPALDLLLTLLADPDLEARRHAASTLARLAPAVGLFAPPQLARLGRAALDRDPVVCAAAYGLLARRREARLLALRIAEKLLRERPAPYRALALRELPHIGAGALPLAVAARSVAGDRGPVDRMLARAFGSLRPTCDAAIRWLADLAQPGVPRDLRQEAFHALDALGPLAAQAAARIAGATAEPDRTIRRAALGALAAMGPAAYVAQFHVEAALDHEDPLTRIAAARAFGAIGSAAETGFEALVRLTREKWVGMRLAAIIALVRVSGTYPGAQRVLSELTAHPCFWTCINARAAWHVISSLRADELDEPAFRFEPPLASARELPALCDALDELDRAHTPGRVTALRELLAREGAGARFVVGRLVAHLPHPDCAEVIAPVLDGLDVTLDQLVPRAAWAAGFPELGDLPPVLAKYATGGGRVEAMLARVTASPAAPPGARHALSRIRGERTGARSARVPPAPRRLARYVLIDLA